MIESEQIQNVLLEHMPDVIMILDRAGTILYINHTLPEYTVEEVTGTCVTDYLPEDHKLNYMQAINEVFQSSQQQNLEVMASGPTCWTARLIPIQNKNGDIESVMSISTDITQRKLIEIERSESEQRFRSLFENSTDAIFIVDPDTQRIYDINDHAIQLLGYSREELLSMSVQDVHPEDRLKEVMEHFDSFRKGEESLALEIPIQHKDGTIMYVDISRGNMTVNGRSYLAGNFRDVTEQKNTKEALKLLTKKLFNVREEEQKKLSRDLHDEFGQWLTVININSQAINNKYASSEPDLREMIENIIMAGDNLYKSMQVMARQLRPRSLDEIGFTDSVYELVSTWKASNPDVNCKLSLEGELETVGDELINSLYRIVQEGLTNISKHAGANNVIIYLSRKLSDDHEKDMIEIQIEDDGIGMLVGDKSDKGLGLPGMRERVLAFDGDFELYSKMDEGLQILIRIPVK